MGRGENQVAADENSGGDEGSLRLGLNKPQQADAVVGVKFQYVLLYLLDARWILEVALVAKRTFAFHTCCD